MVFYYLVPSALYAVYNNLSFLSLAKFDPTTYYLLLQFRVVVTGIDILSSRCILTSFCNCHHSNPSSVSSPVRDLISTYISQSIGKCIFLMCSKLQRLSDMSEHMSERCERADERCAQNCTRQNLYPIFLNILQPYQLSIQ